MYGWDPDDAVYEALAIARLVRAHPHGTEFALRIIQDDTDRPPLLFPIPRENAFFAFVPLPDRRLYLSQAEGLELAYLLTEYRGSARALPERVTHALWLFEYGARIRYLDVAWPHTVTALEALVTTDDRGVAQQFRGRVSAIAEELGIDGLDASLAGKIYSRRSKAVHGRFVRFQDDPESAGVLDLAQQTLRGALRRSIEDQAFANYFVSRNAVRVRWPIATEAPATQ